MNTARAFGPAAVSGFPNDNHWIVRWHFYFNRLTHFHILPPVIHLVPVSRTFGFFRAVTRGKNRERDPLTHMSPRPHVFDMIDKEMLTTHVGHISFYCVVLGGPISRRTPSHRVIRHFETVRHDFFHTTLSDTHTRGIPPFLVFYFAFCRFEEGGLEADAKERCITFCSTASSTGPSILGRKPPSPRCRLEIL